MQFEEYKVAVIGGGGVGKSAITVQFIQNLFITEYDPTIEDSYRKHTKVDDIVCYLEVLDTAGQEEYKALRDQYMRQAVGFLCVYSMIDKASFKELEEYVEQIHRVKDSDQVPMVLVGNKCDLESERMVSKNEALLFAKQKMGIQNDNAVMETSAKLRRNIDECFNELVRIIRRENEKKRPINDEKKKKKKKVACLLL